MNSGPVLSRRKQRHASSNQSCRFYSHHSNPGRIHSSTMERPWDIDPSRLRFICWWTSTCNLGLYNTKIGVLMHFGHGRFQIFQLWSNKLCHILVSKVENSPNGGLVSNFEAIFEILWSLRTHWIVSDRHGIPWLVLQSGISENFHTFPIWADVWPFEIANPDMRSSWSSVLIWQVYQTHIYPSSTVSLCLSLLASTFRDTGTTLMAAINICHLN